MQIDSLPFRETGYFSKLILDYLDAKNELSPFYGEKPTLKGLQNQMKVKETFSKESRKILVASLTNQYQGVKTSETVWANIKALESSKTFTITTGHQLNLFSGPLYFLYKIISVINACKSLKAENPDHHFVPIYWMATEDHDFEEINYFHFKGKKMQWNPSPVQAGAVGAFSTQGLEEVFAALSIQLGEGVHAQYLKELFEKAYLKHPNLSDATRYLANELFQQEGLVIIDAQQRDLKRQLIPYMQKDLFERVAFKKVSEQIKELSKVNPNYPIQVNPREVNYFYLSEGRRNRIVKKGNGFEVLQTEIRFNESELTAEINEFPERFSPNVITRPLYQEVILPNLCYVGGGGELAYWLELKSSFEAQGVPFPVLMLRDSVLVMTEKQFGKCTQLDLKNTDLFLQRDLLINKKIREISNIHIDFSSEKEFLEKHFKQLYLVAQQTDASFLGAVKAQEKKQLKGLDVLEKRLLKAQKRKLKDQVVRLANLQDSLFPSGNLQERTLNFSELYLLFGSRLIQELLEHLDPFKKEFTLLKL